MTTEELLDLVRADFRRDKRFIEAAYRWACRGATVSQPPSVGRGVPSGRHSGLPTGALALLLSGCPSPVPADDRPILVDASDFEPPHRCEQCCATELLRRVDDTHERPAYCDELACECAAETPIITEDRP